MQICGDPLRIDGPDACRNLRAYPLHGPQILCTRSQYRRIRPKATQQSMDEFPADTASQGQSDERNPFICFGMIHVLKATRKRHFMLNLVDENRARELSMHSGADQTKSLQMAPKTGLPARAFRCRLNLF